MQTTRNPTIDALLSGQVAHAIIERDGKYVAWTRTWEGPARPDYPAALADLRAQLERSA